MELEKIEFWTYTSKNGKAQILFDQQTKYIEIDEKDLQGMLDFVRMDKGTYIPSKELMAFYEKLYNQESKDIDNAIHTLKNAKNKDLKTKYKKYIDNLED